MNGLRAYWASLQARERTLLGAGGAILVTSLLYVTVWEPWHTSLNRLRAQVPAREATLEWMRTQFHIAQPLLKQRSSTAGSGRPLLTVIEQSATRAHIRHFVTRIQPSANNAVQVWIENVSFDPWLTWIDAISQQGIEVTATDITRSGPGVVSVRVTLQRAS